MKNNIPICPYYSSYTKSCCHKDAKLKKGKPKCIFKNNPLKCPIYYDWLVISQSCTRVASNRLKTPSHDQHETIKMSLQEMS